MLGTALTVIGLAGYAVGVATPYAGRSFAVTALMVGISLVAIQGAFGSTGVGP